ncbi:hypothetical protein U6S59_12395, partial [Cutibacterium acnes]
MASRRIVDPYEYEHHVSKQNKKLVSDFLFQKDSEGCTADTLKQYRDDMRIVNTYVYRHFENKSLLEMSKKDFIQLLMIHKKRGVSSARLIRILGSIRSCLGVFEDDEDVNYILNVARKIKTPKKVPVKDITFLTDEQVNWMVEQLISQNQILKAIYLKMTYL